MGGICGKEQQVPSRRSIVSPVSAAARRRSGTNVEEKHLDDHDDDNIPDQGKLGRLQTGLGVPKLRSARKLMYLQNSPLGLKLTDDQLHELLPLVHMKTFSPGTWLYKQGEDSESVYIIGSGQIKLFIDSSGAKRRASDARSSLGSVSAIPTPAAATPIPSAGPSVPGRMNSDEKFDNILQSKGNVFSIIKSAGNVFGRELILYKDQKRIASAKAIQTSECISFLMSEIKDFVAKTTDKELVTSFLEALGSKLPAVLSGTQLFTEQSEDFIKNSPVLWCMFRTRHLQKDEILFEQGSIGKTMYVIYDGEVTISLKGEDKNKLIKVSMKEKQTFGEIGLLVDAPRSGTATAATATILLELRSEEFNNLLRSFPAIARKITEIARKNIVFNFRKYEIPFFESLSSEQFNILGQLATIIQIPPGEIIFDINEYGDRFYMIAYGDIGIFVPKEEKKDETAPGVSGALEKTSKIKSRELDDDPENGMVEVCRIGAGRYFGELALVTDSPRCATARAMTKCVILSITRHKFELFFEDNPEALSDFQIKLAKYKITLSQLLAHPRGFQYFLQHCKSEFSSENALFWKEVTEFEQQANKEGGVITPELLEKCDSIAQSYIYDTATTQVNLAWEIRQNLLKDLREKNITKSIYSAAKTAAFMLMEKDSFNRFKSSPLFQEFLKEMEAYEYVQEEAVDSSPGFNGGSVVKSRATRPSIATIGEERKGS